jgi:hypothetical protein
MLNVEPRRTRVVKLVPVELSIANQEPTYSLVAGVPRFLEGLVGQTQAGRAFNTALGEVDGADGVTTALHGVREAEELIRSSAREQRRPMSQGRISAHK